MTTTCWREVCTNPVDPHWNPYCCEACYRLPDLLSALPHPVGYQGATTTRAVVAMSWPWLDSRHPDARPVERTR